jgi:5-methylcytosine-specific restriction endonuclease McrA
VRPTLTIDHRAAERVGGENTLRNLTGACESCNLAKNTTTLLPES